MEEEVLASLSECIQQPGDTTTEEEAEVDDSITDRSTTRNEEHTGNDNPTSIENQDHDGYNNNNQQHPLIIEILDDDDDDDDNAFDYYRCIIEIMNVLVQFIYITCSEVIYFTFWFYIDIIYFIVTSVYQQNEQREQQQQQLVLEQDNSHRHDYVKDYYNDDKDDKDKDHDDEKSVPSNSCDATGQKAYGSSCRHHPDDYNLQQPQIQAEIPLPPPPSIEKVLTTTSNNSNIEKSKTEEDKKGHNEVDQVVTSPNITNNGVENNSCDTTGGDVDDAHRYPDDKNHQKSNLQTEMFRSCLRDDNQMQPNLQTDVLMVPPPPRPSSTYAAAASLTPVVSVSSTTMAARSVCSTSCLMRWRWKCC